MCSTRGSSTVRRRYAPTSAQNHLHAQKRTGTAAGSQPNGSAKKRQKTESSEVKQPAAPAPAPQTKTTEPPTVNGPEQMSAAIRQCLEVLSQCKVASMTTRNFAEHGRPVDPQAKKSSAEEAVSRHSQQGRIAAPWLEPWFLIEHSGAEGAASFRCACKFGENARCCQPWEQAMMEILLKGD